MRKFIICISAIILFVACEEQPKIAYKNKIDTTSVIDDRIRDTTKVLVAELPIKFDSTDILIFAIRLVDLQERGGYSTIGSGSYSSSDNESSYSNQDYLVGNFINVVFQDKDGNERKLTDKKIEIRSVYFLREIFKETKTAYLLYTIYDRDTNGDNQLNNSDLESMYISKGNGTEFKKITKELHEFYDYNLIESENKIYFRTLEDINKDGELNNKDKFHYYRIDFNVVNYMIAEYNPVKIFE